LNCRVLFHDHCFDGACSASLFTRFHRECIGTAQSFDYRGLVHRAGALYDESWFEGTDEAAIVDFKYSPSPRVSWWFDHHQSAFASAADEAGFLAKQAEAAQGPIARTGGQFFDPTYLSCTGWIAHIAAARFGMDVAPLAELIHWADIVDGAKYESAQAAVEMQAPAMQLTLIIESAPEVEGRSISHPMIPLLAWMPLAEVLAQTFVQAQLGPLLERHWQALELLRSRARCERGVIDFDITDQPAEGYNKFIPYYLHPEGTYNVGLSRSSFRNKVSVGTNPWTSKPAAELANIAAICGRFGGGGHARVGAISFPVEQPEEARRAAAQIAEELRARA